MREPVHAARAHLQRRALVRGDREVQQVAVRAEEEQQLLPAAPVAPAARAQRQRAEAVEQRAPRQLQPAEAVQRGVERVEV